MARTDPAAADALACLSNGGTAASSDAADVRALTTDRRRNAAAHAVGTRLP